MMIYALVHASKAILGMSINPCDVNVIVLGKCDQNAGVIISQEVACMNVCDTFHPFYIRLQYNVSSITHWGAWHALSYNIGGWRGYCVLKGKRAESCKKHCNKIVIHYIQATL